MMGDDHDPYVPIDVVNKALKNPFSTLFSQSRVVFLSNMENSAEQNNLVVLVVLGFNATLTAKVISMAVGDAHVFPGFLTPVLTTFLSKASDYFSHMLLQR